MSELKDFHKLDYFLSHYFLQTFGLEELDKIAYDFRYRESEDSCQGFLNEVSFIFMNKNWKVAKKVFSKNDCYEDEETIENVVTVIYKALTDPAWDKETYKPFAF